MGLPSCKNAWTWKHRNGVPLTRLSAANVQHQTLSMEHRSLQEQMERSDKMHEQKLESLEVGVRLKEQQLAQLESDVVERQRALIAKEENFAKTELAMQGQHQEREQLAFDRENLEKERLENRSLKATVQEQKGMLFDLESQLHREQTISNFITPGEFIRLAKKQEGELYAHDNAARRLKNFGLETEVKQVRWHNEVMKKHLPQSAHAEVAKVVNAKPLPVGLGGA